MPKIKITERDITGVVQPSQISNTVFVPIARKETAGAMVRDTFAKINSISDLNKYIGETYLSMYETDMGYKLCKHLLNVGLDVLVTIADSGKDIDWENLKDKSLFDIRFITLGDMTDAEGMTAAKACAEYRGDCTALFNLPTGFAYSIEEASTELDENGEPVPADEDAPTTVVEKIKKYFETAGASEYCACFAPNFLSLNGDLSMKVVNEDKSVKNPNNNEEYYSIVYDITEAEIPAAFGYLFAYASAIKNNPEWYAIAGFQRGFIPELSDVCYELTTAEMNKLQCREKELYDLDDEADNVGTAINPIAYIRPAGHIIYGNRTFRYNDASKKTIATSFLNVRNMVSAIKKKLYDASRKFTFEPNNELLWVRFTSFVSPYLDKIQSGNGILGYKFERVATTAKARLACKLIIIPVEAVEDFEIEIILTDDLTVVE